MSHQWVKLHDLDITNMFMFDDDFHNGPQCERCLAMMCVHCHPEFMDSPCPDLTLTP